MNSTKEIPIEQSICLSCGICCDGTLFNRAPIKPKDDLTALLSFKNTIIKDETKTAFKLPCAAHQNKCCQIYDLPRPAICGNYRCMLLKRYEKGNISFEDAQKTINRVFELREIYKTELERVVPEAYKIPVWESKDLLPENEAMIADPILLKKWSAVMMSFSALLDCLQTNFQRPQKEE